MVEKKFSKEDAYMASDTSSVQSVDRAFDILEALSSSPHGRNLTELSAAVGLHVSTTHRLLGALASRGYVQKDIESGKYRLTMRLFEIGGRAVNGMNLVSLSRPFLEYLASSTGETIHLVARSGDEVVYIYKEDTGSSVIRMASFVGLRRPMYCTAVGKGILAYLPETEVEAIWGRTEITAFTPNTIVDLPRLTAELSQIRRQGYALDLEEHELGILCVAAPIFDYLGVPIAAISISSPASRMNAERIECFSRELISAAESITRLLGGSQRPAQG